MNSLNIISARVSPPSSPTPSRSNSFGTLGIAVASPEEEEKGSSCRARGAEDELISGSAATTNTGSYTEAETATASSEKDALLSAEPESFRSETAPAGRNYHLHHLHSTDREPALDERIPLLGSLGETKEISPRHSPAWQWIPKRIASTFLNSIRWVLSTLAAPGVYLIACLYDQNGNFAPWIQLRKLFGNYNRNARKIGEDYHEALSHDGPQDGRSSTRGSGARYGEMAVPQHMSGSSSSSGLSSESESDQERKGGAGSSSRNALSKHSRSKSLQDTDEIAPARRSIRIKLHSDEALRQRKHKKAQSTNTRNSTSGSTGDISAQLKSPTSPVGALTKYPKAPAPPRPLIPRRQASYVNAEPGAVHQKTLILDLDETLIHSMSKGGRMGTGHMVEVRLNTTYVGVGGQASIGPQHPILYFVHKRPHCDDFLRRISKWFNLVVFTASVQEYADPVIDWLETDRKFFSGRYYRQHCTFRHGAFIKDLSSVEPDLSRVMILDNSPLSYMFHQDNAIPIQGWINDPTDNDLLHLVPFLEGLQYVSDVRALLALRGGEDGKHMA